MAKQAQLELKTKTQAKSNMCLYLLLTSLPPLNGSESLRSEMVLLLSMKGKRAALTKRITEEIKRKCKQSNGGTEFVSVDEYLTNQICNKCKSKQLNNISVTGSKRRAHSVLKCESCCTVWNCNVNSALNINGIFVYKSKHDNENPPSPFKRPSKD
ncbi:hypothetical protein G6F70_009254 [Rhizopus microsporus]|uniref:Cas12f1-like TNB domain-containing protein n=1 Tax=Rhizopus microsporus TaxID=58291 RepID=A0A1X0RKT8_RHIZD|nr:hypothetical protein G6F71_009249 [Rhizopus microsporus]KAG1192018.1 hypothetical protein G6F70_009254 [Rhizopus microsporus]KAG1205832.1 hypothetical protein G6F69_009237 [Rhizopus microsporus]KAG1225619.1 hypothetical protein G6F67_009255 [Rhizopus microsporus]KAG1256470.1 hypothetical protein G6F68_009771 [Rhizopus microsporus]